MNWPFLSHMYLLKCSQRTHFHLILVFLCSAQSPIAKIPSLSKSAWPGNTHLSHTVTSYTQLGLIQDFPSECGKLTAVGRWGRQWWGTGRTVRCGAWMLSAPAKSQAQSSLPDWQQTLRALPQKHLAMSADHQPQRLQPQSSKHSCKLPDDHQGTEVGGNELGTARG